MMGIKDFDRGVDHSKKSSYTPQKSPKKSKKSEKNPKNPTIFGGIY